MRKIAVVLLTAFLIVVACKKRNLDSTASSAARKKITLNSSGTVTKLQLDRWAENSKHYASAFQQIIKNFGSNFTVAINSESIQGTTRAIFFSDEGNLFIALSPESKDIEGVELRETKTSTEMVPFSYSWDEVASEFRYEERPKECQGCHDHNIENGIYEFGLIWDDYRVWEDILGGNDDQIQSVEKYNRVVKEFDVEGLSDLFSKKSFPYPYYDDVEKRQLINMPNLRLTQTIGNRIGKVIFSRVNSIEVLCNFDINRAEKSFAEEKGLIIPRRGFGGKDFAVGAGNLNESIFQAAIFEIANEKVGDKFPSIQPNMIKSLRERIVNELQFEKDRTLDKNSMLFDLSEKFFERYVMHGVKARDIFRDKLCN